jgi:rubrerythrin
MKRDQATYEELRQDASRKWRLTGQIRQQQADERMGLLRRPWRCYTCGTMNSEQSGVCPKCRGARMLEL